MGLFGSNKKSVEYIPAPPAAPAPPPTPPRQEAISTATNTRDTAVGAKSLVSTSSEGLKRKATTAKRSLLGGA